MNKTTDQASAPSASQKLLQEPMLHFFLIGLLIFALYAFSQSSKEDLLEVNRSDIDARITMVEISSGEELSEDQRELLTARYIEEQILVQEALAMELDNDARIHDILAQKMRHVLSGDIIQPDQQELQDYYQQNRERYRNPATITVDELVFDNRGELAPGVIELLKQSGEPEDLLTMEEGSLSSLPGVNLTDLNNIFEESFANGVFNSAMGDWNGPFISNRGQHWLRVTARNDTALPALEEITDLVRLDWIASEEEQRLQQEVDRLWDKYSITIIENLTE
jgi:hypothetical protein